MGIWRSFVLAIAACSSGTTTTTTTATGGTPGSASPLAAPPDATVALPATSGTAVKVTLAEVGLEAVSLDRTADPCVDFYQFACGGWLAANPIPPDRARWARFSEIDEKTKAAIRTLLEEAAGNPSDASAQQLGDFYAACMDEAAIERSGLSPVKPVLDRLARVKDPRSWLAAVAELHRLGRWVVWSDQVLPDFKDSTTNLTYLDAAGLGLPDRDYYVKPELADKLAAYRAHVGRMLAAGGMPEPRAAAAAGEVIAIETELAKLTKTAVEQRDVQAAYNPTDATKLARTTRSIDWKAYWKAMGTTPSKKLVLGTPRFFAALDKLRAQFKYPQWASYFTYHFLAHGSLFLPRAIDDEAFALSRALTGVEQPQERAKRCVEATEHALGELLGKLYVARHFPPASKDTATGLVDELVKVMGDEIARLDWMSEPTRRIAHAKLGKIVRMIGYPDRWKTYDFEVRRDDLAGNVMRAAVFESKRELGKAGKPVDRAEWHMNAYTVNAYYNPLANNTALPAGILQPPFFGQDRSVAANLGGIGMVIGHELTHGFDDQGAQFDAGGNLVNWWKPEDAQRFAEKATCVAEQYATFEALPKQFVNGRLTLGENIADLGGVKMAFQAYRGLREGAARRYVADGFDEDQQFFLGVAQAWCSKDRPAEIQRRLVVDPHSPPKFRVYGALRNLPAFAEAFRCAAGTPMRPAATCAVW
jgi:putative endopeptidase